MNFRRENHQLGMKASLRFKDWTLLLILGRWRSSLLLAFLIHYLVCIPVVLSTLAQLFN